MLIGKAKSPDSNAARLNKLVARWQDEAAFPDGREADQRNTWAEHLKRVADEYAKSGEEQEVPNTGNGADRRAA